MEKMSLTEMEEKAIELIKSDDDLLVELVEELDNWNGYADGFRCYPMCELDEFYAGCTASKLLNDITSDFRISDDWFYYSIYGLESTDDRAELYRDHTSAKEIFDRAEENWYRLRISASELCELMEAIDEARNWDAFDIEE